MQKEHKGDWGAGSKGDTRNTRGDMGQRGNKEYGGQKTGGTWYPLVTVDTVGTGRREHRGTGDRGRT